MGNKQDKKPISTELTDKQIALLKANTKYTEKQIRDWHAGFIKDCPDGRLDKNKFVESYKQFYPKGKPDNYCKYAFKTFDANNDGTIDFEEFLMAMSVSGETNLDLRLPAAFDLFDISNDGLIDQKELATIISAMYDLVGETDRKDKNDPKKRAAEIIAQLDITGDKKLNKEEFVAGCKSDPHICQLLAPKA